MLAGLFGMRPKNRKRVEPRKLALPAVDWKRLGSALIGVAFGYFPARRAASLNPIDALRPVYGELLSDVARAAAALRKPVLLVHGDTHTYRVDHPFAHVTRAETFGAPLVGWLKVTVDPGSEAVFGFEAKR